MTSGGLQAAGGIAFILGTICAFGGIPYAMENAIGGNKPDMTLTETGIAIAIGGVALACAGRTLEDSEDDAKKRKNHMRNGQPKIERDWEEGLKKAGAPPELIQEIKKRFGKNHNI